MADPILIAVAVVVCTVIIWVIFYYYYSANSFDTNKYASLQDTEEKKKKKPTSKSKKSKNNKSAGPVSTKPQEPKVDLEKFKSRLASIEDLEEEYMTFLNAHLRKLNNQLNNLTESLAIAQNAKAEADEKLKEANKGRLLAEKQVSDSKSSLLELDEKVRKLTSELKESSIGLAKAQKSKHEAVSALKSATDEQSRVDGQLTVIRMELAKSRGEVKAMASRLITNETEKHALAEQVNSLEANLAGANTRAAELEQLQQERRDLLRIHEEEKMMAEEEIKKALNELSLANSLLSEIKRHAEVLEQRNVELEKSVREFQERPVQESVVLPNDELQKVKEERDRLQEKNKELRERNQTLAERLGSMEATLKQAVHEEKL